MKITSQLFIAAFAFLALATSAHAQPPREQLKQMVQQLQKTPNDNALREKIIKLARTMKPVPVVPDSAVAFEGRAQFAFRSAKSEGDFLAAAQEYEKAVGVAPWVPGYYADLCTIYEKAGKFEDAKRHCGFYLTGLTDPARITDVKRRIGGLEFGIEKAIEKANSPQAREAREAARKKEVLQLFIASLEGRKYICDGFTSVRQTWERWIEITNGKIVGTQRLTWVGTGWAPDWKVGLEQWFIHPLPILGKITHRSDTNVEIFDDRIVWRDLNEGGTCRRQY